MRAIEGQRFVGTSQGPAWSGEQRILLFQLESYFLPRKFIVVMGLSRKPCWIVRGLVRQKKAYHKIGSTDACHF